MSKPKCPNCDSSTLSVERRPDGDARCAMCGWSGKYAACFGETYKVAIQNPEARIKELEAQLKEANAVAEFYAKKSSWSRGEEAFDVCISDSEGWPVSKGGKRARAYLKKREGK